MPEAGDPGARPVVRGAGPINDANSAGMAVGIRPPLSQHGDQLGQDGGAGQVDGGRGHAQRVGEAADLMLAESGIELIGRKRIVARCSADPRLQKVAEPGLFEALAKT